MFDRPFTDYVCREEGATEGTPAPALLFGTVREVREEANCSLCRLVWKSFVPCDDDLQPPEQADGDEVSITVESVACGLNGPTYTFVENSDDKEEPEPEPSAIRLHFSLSPWIWKSPNERNSEPGWLGVIHRVDESKAMPNKLCCGRQIGEEGPEGSMMRRWLQICQERHVLCQNKYRNYEYPSHLVDIRKACLVEESNVPSHPKYAILSYVWGKEPTLTLNSSTSALLHSPGMISTKNAGIPATIRDTLRVCQTLDQQYLWVDALCIKQDGLADKLAEIAHMDDIYGGADLTIVAASGDRASAGLPGAGNTPRVNTQLLVEVEGFMLANLLPRNLVDESIWNTRAWTYQERLLSRRLLSFTDRQIFFACRQMQCCEDTVTEFSAPISQTMFEAASHPEHDEDGIPLRTPISPLEYPEDDMTEFQKYAHLVTEYSKRSLSFESDVLNAFRGVMSQLSLKVLQSETRYNLPLRLIDVAILWRPLGPLRKRDSLNSAEIIPSWAWASWVGPIEYPELRNLAERTLSQRIEQFAKVSCKMPPSEPAHWAKKDETQCGYRRQVVEGEIWYSSRLMDNKKSASTGLLCRPAYDYHQQDFDPDSFSHILTLRTSVADLCVTKQHVADYDHYFNTPRCTTTSHQVCHLLITDSHRVKAGLVVVDGNTASSLQPGTFSFVKLSRTTNLHDDDDSAWDAETGAFAGVPGQPAINPDFEPITNPDPNKSSEELWFNSDAFDSSICWCLYNVMMVEWREDGVGLRLGIGKIHVHAFDAVAGDERSVDLG